MPKPRRNKRTKARGGVRGEPMQILPRTKKARMDKSGQPPHHRNPIAKFNPRVNRPKVFVSKRFQGPEKEEWDW